MSASSPVQTERKRFDGVTDEVILELGKKAGFAVIGEYAGGEKFINRDGQALINVVRASLSAARQEVPVVCTENKEYSPEEWDQVMAWRKTLTAHQSQDKQAASVSLGARATSPSSGALPDTSGPAAGGAVPRYTVNLGGKLEHVQVRFVSRLHVHDKPTEANPSPIRMLYVGDLEKAAPNAIAFAINEQPRAYIERAKVDRRVSIWTAVTYGREYNRRTATRDRRN